MTTLFPPALTGVYTDPSVSTRNSIFPHVTNYADGRLLSLILSIALSTLVLLLYTCRLCSRRALAALARLDAFSAASVIVGATGTGKLAGCRSVPHTTALGGVLSVVATLTALGVSLDTLLLYASDVGLASTSLLPPLSLQPDLISSQATLTALASAVGASAPPLCTFTGAASSGALVGTWTVTSRTMITTPASGGSNMSTYACSYSFSCPSLLLSSAYPDPTLPSSQQAPASFGLTLGGGLQLTSWSITISDAKAGTFTSCGPASPVPTGIATLPAGANASLFAPLSGPAAAAFVPSSAGAVLVASSTRLHTARLQLMSSTYVDTSFSDSVGDAVAFGLRASALSLTVEAASGDWSGNGAMGGDALVLVFMHAGSTLLTTVSPRFSVLALLGILTGLCALSFFVFKGLHDVLDAVCGCARVEREAELKELELLDVGGSSSAHDVSPSVARPAGKGHFREPSMRLVPVSSGGPLAGPGDGSTASPAADSAVVEGRNPLFSHFIPRVLRTHSFSKRYDGSSRTGQAGAPRISAPAS